MRWRVESWDPGYGASTEDQGDWGRSSAQVVTDVEVPEARWEAIDPDPNAGDFSSVLFVDGVRRIDAMAWVLDNEVSADPAAALALCASYAAGVVRCRAGEARLVTAEVRRGLFSGAEGATDVDTSAGRYVHVHAATKAEAGVPAQDLSQAVQFELRAVEIAAASSARAGADPAVGDDDVLVVDGPLHGRAHLPRALGYVKTHSKPYLPDTLHGLVGRLTTGQRTPVFGLGTSWHRYSWYLKLPGGSGAPWAGVVRVECSSELPIVEVIELARRSQPMLCRYASTEYKDSRAPQNLYPIAGLERELRRRMGDQSLLYRAIRRAAI
ncbi:hypothetical protein [Pseudonocardia spinosispora]|uniref:hypothetical protein n=1 Tax=Pseudonocardia spinosispora TaxID=103441 RepID=UPI00041F3BCA|nr:hypothetical protein [Pseudonocardia spinosispora]